MDEPLYWLAGARWETLRHCPATERERVAVVGSTVLIPTIMSFLGMIVYAKSRFAEPPWRTAAGEPSAPAVSLRSISEGGNVE